MADNKTQILINKVNYDDNGNVTIEGYEPTSALFDGDAAITRVKITVNIEGGASFTLTDANDTNRILQQKELLKLTDIPDVMEQKGWKVAAMLQRDWFKRQAFVILDKDRIAENPDNCHFTWKHNQMLSQLADELSAYVHLFELSTQQSNVASRTKINSKNIKAQWYSN